MQRNIFTYDFDIQQGGYVGELAPRILEDLIKQLNYQYSTIISFVQMILILSLSASGVLVLTLSSKDLSFPTNIFWDTSTE